VCGIAGFIAPQDEKSIRRMMQAIAHRGPDGEGALPLRSGNDVVGWFGHKRLAILDLSDAARQPMRSEDGRFTITYNGEIYNFAELRTKLERAGECFTSRSDTEVVLKAFRAWGENALREFRGMFAFAIWDAECCRLFIARDPLGIKPLYYYRNNGRFYFASELRSLLTSGGLHRRLSAAGLHDYLRLGSVCDPHTMIEGAASLLPGHYLIWENGTLQSVQYWDIPPAGCDKHANTLQPPDRKTPDQLRQALWDATGQCLVSDVPIGVFLSGGMDSSALVGIMSSLSKEQVNTFSIVFREQAFNEAAYSRAVAARFGTCHHELILSQRDVLEALPEAIRAMDQPSVDGINTYVVARETRRAGIKVALTGLGGDEVFGGYRSFRSLPRMERLVASWNRIPSTLRAPLIPFIPRIFSGGERQQKIRALLQSNGRAIHPYEMSRTLFVPDRIEHLLRVRAEAVGDEVDSQRMRTARQLDPVNRISYLELHHYTANTLLRDADSMSMAHGLEVRIPFLDRKLVEFLFSIPGSLKVHGRINKPLLVEAVRGLLPESVIDRPKRGFTLPFEHWLKEELGAEMQSTFQGGAGPLENFIDRQVMQEVWHDFLDGRTSWSRPWSLYVLRRWCDLNLG
jgi:asparagine synthase (glutamine-hydrolysing)